ncbi:immunity 53 family protein [Patescibacteria group bacterium]|nr:immunity 53 family protein [Patescibacteria group bacterium]MBU1015943.1 immunity 53 family protein [Patescibacteria group bacterium]MBU1938408.1 immunity 53 family protein [Patescibacteria group bacterium]
MNNLKWLQQFYKSQCNCEWEHTYGIKIDTLDNPGWGINIDLYDTDYRERKFDELRIERSENDWIICKIEKYIFKGAGGPQNLDEIIGVFRNWIEKQI